MPEPYWPKRKSTYTLSHARKHHEIARIWCRYCKTERHFWIDDLKLLFGPDVECDDVVYQPGWSCVQCGKDSLSFELVQPSAADRQKMIIRRIGKIRYVRKIEWRDEQP